MTEINFDLSSYIRLIYNQLHHREHQITFEQITHEEHLQILRVYTQGLLQNEWAPGSPFHHQRPSRKTILTYIREHPLRDIVKEILLELADLIT